MPLHPLPPELVKKLKVMVANATKPGDSWFKQPSPEGMEFFRKNKTLLRHRVEGDKLVRIDSSRLDRFLQQMRNIDQRGGGDKRKSVNDPEGRVRLLDVHHNYPEVGAVVLKKVHSNETAEGVIRTLTERVEYLNGKKPSHLSFDKPHIYELDEGYVAMAHTDLPTFGNVKEEHLKRLGISWADFTRAVDEFERLYPRYRSRDDRNNFFVKSYKDGKLHLVPVDTV